MFPKITINGQELSQPQVRLLRKLVMDYFTWLSETIWEYVEKNDENMGSLPDQRVICLLLLQAIDRAKIPMEHSTVPFGSNVTVHGKKIAFNQAEIVRMSLSFGPRQTLTQEEEQDLGVMQAMIFNK